MSARATWRANWFSLAVSALGGLVLLFVAAPLLGMLLQSSGAELADAASDPEVRGSVWLTLWTAMGATVGAGVAAVPFAYLLARREFPLKRLVTGLIDVPIVIPHSAAGIALLALIARGGPVGRAATALTGKAGFSLVNTPWAIMAAMAFVSVPFLVNAARDGFLAVPRRLEQAAMTLGASPARTFFTVSLPMAWRPVLSGLIMMWARGMSEFGAVLIVAYHPRTTPVLLYERFGAFGLKYARPVAVLFIGICLALFVILRVIAWEERRAEG